MVRKSSTEQVRMDAARMLELGAVWAEAGLEDITVDEAHLIVEIAKLVRQRLHRDGQK
jgi:hypothetical protein